ncbi:MAG: pro-sigmaK processing inhibitor BofA family protein [Bacillota bacterium]
MDFSFYFLAGLILLLLMARFFAGPLKLAFKLILNAICGGLVLTGVNFFSRWTGFFLPLNAYTVLFTGLLGVPGVMALVFIKLWFLK